MGTKSNATKNIQQRVVLAFAFAAIATAALLAGIALTSGTSEAAAESTSIEVDIVEDGNLFIFDDAPLFDDGMPAGGNSFVTQGYIYEAGAIADGAGIDDDGSPTDPDKVLGTWICEGHMIADGAHTETGAWVVSKQIFSFGDDPTAETIVTQGLELVDFGVEAPRAVVGGTGPFTGATGAASQVLHGFTETMGVQLTVSFDVETPAAVE